MKQFQSTSEQNWVQVMPISLSQQEKDLLFSKDKKNDENRDALIKDINTRRFSSVDAETLTKLNAFYTSIKPSIKEGETYELIAIDVFDNLGGFSGILNYRINKEHLQIRF